MSGKYALVPHFKLVHCILNLIPEKFDVIGTCGEFSQFWSLRCRDRKSLHVHDESATLEQHVSLSV
jgi:hypothetical protein